MWLRLILFFFSASAVASHQALAESFSFSASAPLFGFSTSGVITATAQANGSYLASNIAGTNITGLIATGGFDNNDNLLFPSSSSSVDARGLAFTIFLNGVTYSADVFSSLGSYAGTFYSTATGTGTAPVSFQLQAYPSSQVAQTAVPEPSSLFLLGTAVLILALGVLVRSHSKRSHEIRPLSSSSI